MLEIKGYEINEILYSGNLSSVYRGIRKADAEKVIIKTTNSDQPKLDEIAAIQNEYQLIKQLNSAYIIEAYDLIMYHNRPMFIMEDIEGVSLKQYLSGKPIALKEFFILSLQITEALHAIYCKNIIHKDFSLQNIIINTKTLAIK